jgi:phosphatidylethanolamine-binding protein (PEBP) family uncharacterized protein
MKHRARILSTCIGAVMLGVSGCASSDGRRMQEPADYQPVTIGTQAPTIDDGNGWTLTTPWADSGEIGARYTCDGLSVSPPMVWTEGPEMTRAYAISMMNMAGEVLWAVADIPVATRNLVEGTSPEGATVAVNAAGALGYQAPCPEPGQSDSFTVVLYAQEFPTELETPADAEELVRLLEDTSLDQEITTFSYQRN